MSIGFVDDNTDILDVIEKHKSICWYPSAGDDFRPLIFFNPYTYEDLEIPMDKDQVFPDLFILTDVLYPSMYPMDFIFDKSVANLAELNDPEAWKGMTMLYDGLHTRISIKRIRKLKKMVFSLSKETLSYDYDNHDNYGNVFCFDTHVRSKRYGSSEWNEWDVTVLYVVVENMVFARDFLMKNSISVDYLPVVRYGESMGGALLGPNWIRNILGYLKCKYFICNPCYREEARDMSYFEGYNISPTKLEEIKRINKEKWSDYEEIIWNRVSVRKK